MICYLQQILLKGGWKGGVEVLFPPLPHLFNSKQSNIQEPLLFQDKRAYNTTVYTHVLVDLMYKSNSILSQIGWNHTNPYIRRGERGCIISEKNSRFLWQFAVSVLGYQVQTIPQFLNYIRWSISGCIW